MRKKLLYLLIVLLLASSLILTACGGNNDNQNQNTEMNNSDNDAPADNEPAADVPVDPEPVESRGVLNFDTGLAYGGNENLDPTDASRFWPAIAILFDRLVEPGFDALTPNPSLALSWEPNDAADTWTFYLREDAFFHDGTQVTSAAVAYSVAHWQTETSVLASTFGIVESVDTPDDFTVVFNLTATNVEFPAIMMDYRARVLPVDGLPGILETGIGSGPFKLEKLDVGGISVFTANDDYWGGPPGVASIEVHMISDVEASMQGLLAGQLDFSDFGSYEQSQWFVGNDDFVITQNSGGGWSGFVMRTDIPPFDNLELRQAIHLMVDRQEMVDLALSGAGTVSCDTTVQPGDPDQYIGDCPQDLEGAAAKLAASGFEGELDLYTAEGVCSDWSALSEIFQQQAAEIGLTVNLITAPADGFWSWPWMVEPFVMTCWGSYSANASLNLMFKTGGAWNESYWNVPEFDALLDAASAEKDDATRRQHYVDAQIMLNEGGGVIVPYFANLFRVQKTCVENIPTIGTYWMDWEGITKPADCD